MHGMILEARNLGYSQILRNLNFTWRQGETIALMGANGSGKSTLARLLAGLVEPTSGSVKILDENLPAREWTHERWQVVGLVGQHPRRQCIGASVAEELSFGLINLGLPNQEVRDRVGGLIQTIGLEGKENQSVATLSGGERQRLVIAAILALNPKFVILDESLSMLDMRTKGRILELLDSMGKEKGKLWITHDFELAAKADRLWLLKDGHLWDVGQPEPFLSDPMLCQRFSLGSHSQVLEANTVCTKVETGFKEGSCGKTGSGASAALEETKTSQSDIIVWDNVEIEERLKVHKTVHSGEFIGIVGASGSGKSTLLESAVGLITPKTGIIRVDGVELNRKNVVAVRRQNRLLLQEAGEYLVERTVREVVFWREKGLDPDAESEYLDRFNIPPALLSRSPEMLSGGERQKVALAAALRTDPKVLLLDEPMLGLDAQSRSALAKVITELSSKLTILYVTHDLCEVLPYADRLWLVDRGQVVLDCSVKAWQKYREQFEKAGVRTPN